MPGTSRPLSCARRCSPWQRPRLTQAASQQKCDSATFCATRPCCPAVRRGRAAAAALEHNVGVLVYARHQVVHCQLGAVRGRAVLVEPLPPRAAVTLLQVLVSLTPLIHSKQVALI